MKKFTVTGEHILLLRRFNIIHSFDGMRLPAVDDKRPFGSSDPYQDIAEIFGEDTTIDEWGDHRLSEEQVTRYQRLLEEMTTVVQILVLNLGIETGKYRASRYGTDWTREEDS